MQVTIKNSHQTPSVNKKGCAPGNRGSRYSLLTAMTGLSLASLGTHSVLAHPVPATPVPQKSRAAHTVIEVAHSESAACTHFVRPSASGNVRYNRPEQHINPQGGMISHQHPNLPGNRKEFSQFAGQRYARADIQELHSGKKNRSRPAGNNSRQENAGKNGRRKITRREQQPTEYNRTQTRRTERDAKSARNAGNVQFWLPLQQSVSTTAPRLLVENRKFGDGKPEKATSHVEHMQQKEYRRWLKLYQNVQTALKFESIEQLYQRWLKKTENVTTTTGLLRVQYIRLQAENYRHWLWPTRNVITYLQSHPSHGYLTLVDTRLRAARLFPGLSENDSLSDEQLFTSINQMLNPLEPRYSPTLAIKFVQYEALIYYISAKAVIWDFDLTASDIEYQFLAAHITHNQIFEPKNVISFYNAQFRVAQRQPAGEFKNRNQLGLEAYYAQFNHYLKNYASDDAAKIVEQTAVLMNISQLDLERQFTPLFSLRLGYYQSELLPQTAQRTETFKPGGFIYILQGNSGKCYAASTWGSLFVVAEVSELFTPDKVIRISALPDGRIVNQLTAKVLLTALWPNGGDFIAMKPMIIAKYSNSIFLDGAASSLRDGLIKLQHEVIKNYVDVWRDQHLDKTTTERILSFVPFFEVIQRKINDPQYSPSLKDLAFDLFDVSLMLLSLGVPLIKLGVGGIKAALMAIKAGRAAGLTGIMLRQVIWNAIKPTLKKMATITVKEISGFMIPPVDLFTVLRKPMIKKLGKVNKTKLRVRCIRAPDGLCTFWIPTGGTKTVTDSVSVLSTTGLSDCSALIVLTDWNEHFYAKRTLIHLNGSNVAMGLEGGRDATSLIGDLQKQLQQNGGKVIWVGGSLSESRTGLIISIGQTNDFGKKPILDLLNIPERKDVVIAGSSSVSVKPDGTFQLNEGGKGMLNEDEINEILSESAAW